MHDGFDPDAGEPYPLILVRPHGEIAYGVVREAIRSWGSEFGYELIENDWELRFPQRSRAWIVSSPRQSTKRADASGNWPERRLACTGTTAGRSLPSRRCAVDWFRCAVPARPWASRGAMKGGRPAGFWPRGRTGWRTWFWWRGPVWSRIGGTLSERRR